MSHPPVILEVPFYPLIDYSGIKHDLVKMQSRPQGVEEIGRIRTNWAATALEVIRTYSVPWSQVWAFHVWCRGFSFREVDPNDGLGAPTEISRVIPAQDPVFPYLYADSVRLLEGHGAVINDPYTYPRDRYGFPLVNQPLLPALCFVDNSEAGWASQGNVLQSNDGNDGTDDPEDPGGGGLDPDPDDPEPNTEPSRRYRDGRCTVEVTYRALRYQIRSDADLLATGAFEPARYIERKYQPSIEALPFSRLATAGQVSFAEGPFGPDFGSATPIPEAGVVLTASMAVEWHWKEVPDPPLTRILDLMGTVNESPFDGPAFGATGYIEFAAETLLFQQPSWEQRRDVLGRPVFDMVLRALWRPNTWNKYPASDGNYYLATYKGEPDGRKVYRPAEWLDAIFGATLTVVWQ